MGYLYADSSMLKGASFKNKNRGVSLPQYGSGTPEWAATECKDYKDISSNTFGQTRCFGFRSYSSRLESTETLSSFSWLTCK